MKNAVKLLGGKRKEEAEGEKEGREEDGGGERGGRGEMLCSELTVRGKTRLLELLVTLVKGGVEVSDEEELMEVVMRLEEEANESVEEGEGEGEGEGEEKGREKREWEELSERAHEFVWVIETMKRCRGRREENRKAELEWTEKRKEECIEKENDRMKKENVEIISV